MLLLLSPNKERFLNTFKKFGVSISFFFFMYNLIQWGIKLTKIYWKDISNVRKDFYIK